MSRDLYSVLITAQCRRPWVKSLNRHETIQYRPSPLMLQLSVHSHHPLPPSQTH